MRQTELSLKERGRKVVDEFRSKGLHMAREFNRAACCDLQIEEALKKLQAQVEPPPTATPPSA